MPTQPPAPDGGAPAEPLAVRVSAGALVVGGGVQTRSMDFGAGAAVRSLVARGVRPSSLAARAMPSSQGTDHAAGSATSPGSSPRSPAATIAIGGSTASTPTRLTTRRSGPAAARSPR
ncbi:hypothetical protein DMB66_06075 [Actinoplanes sp. ATCC 53533]|nr:hypothetical protein DMB66_06075 [Actinoplanes sp. ATCC 53533]